MIKRTLLCGAMLSLALALPALGAEDDVVSARVVAPAENASLARTVILQGRASSAAGIRTVEILIGDQVVATEQPADFQQTVDISYNWDTRFEPGTSKLASNGYYVVGVRATANGEDNTDFATVPVKVDNIPTSPGGLRGAIENGSVRLEWFANPEPDIVGYRIFRRRGGSFSAVGTSEEPGFLDTPLTGRYSYRVVALRQSPSLKAGRPSVPSAPLRVVLTGPNGEGAGGGFVVGGKEAAPKGLPGSTLLSDMGDTGLPELPIAAAAEPAEDWGTFEKKLPYKVPDEFKVLSGGDDERATWSRFIPPDGLRWLAAGVLLLVVAAQARFIASRIASSRSS